MISTECIFSEVSVAEPRSAAKSSNGGSWGKIRRTWWEADILSPLRGFLWSPPPPSPLHTHKKQVFIIYQLKRTSFLNSLRKLIEVSYEIYLDQISQQIMYIHMYMVICTYGYIYVYLFYCDTAIKFLQCTDITKLIVPMRPRSIFLLLSCTVYQMRQRSKAQHCLWLRSTLIKHWSRLKILLLFGPRNEKICTLLYVCCDVFCHICGLADCRVSS